MLVGAHAPEFGFEHDLDNVRRATRELGVGYPVVIDNDFAIWRSFDNHYWPAVYLVDREGEVRFSHFGEGDYEETERAIQQLLGVEEETVRVDADDLAEAADLGHARIPGDLPRDPHAANAGTSRPSDGLALNHWALEGAWSVGDEAAVLDVRPRLAQLLLPGPRRQPRPRATGGRGSRSASPCASTGSPPAMRMASTSTRRARAPSRSRGCTSSSASERQWPNANVEITFLDSGVRAYVFTFG